MSYRTALLTFSALMVALMFAIAPTMWLLGKWTNLWLGQ